VLVLFYLNEQLQSHGLAIMLEVPDVVNQEEVFFEVGQLPFFMQFLLKYGWVQHQAGDLIAPAL